MSESIKVYPKNKSSKKKKGEIEEKKKKKIDIHLSYS